MGVVQDWGHPRGQAIVAYEKKKAPIAVLGMHRSGTRCLTGCLAESGLALGEVNQSAPHNRRGNQENRRIMDLHEDVLRDSGGSWRDPPEKIVWTHEHRVRRDVILTEYEAYEVWGFKDPRTLWMIDGWREAVPDMRLVGSFRHPAAGLRRFGHATA